MGLPAIAHGLSLLGVAGSQTLRSVVVLTAARKVRSMAATNLPIGIEIQFDREVFLFPAHVCILSLLSVFARFFFIGVSR